MLELTTVKSQKERQNLEHLDMDGKYGIHCELQTTKRGRKLQHQRQQKIV